MEVTKKHGSVMIKQWRREINGSEYKFRAMYWTDSHLVTASFVAEKKLPRGWTFIHEWVVYPDGIVKGSYPQR